VYHCGRNQGRQSEHSSATMTKVQWSTHKQKGENKSGRSHKITEGRATKQEKKDTSCSEKKKEQHE